MDHRWLLRLALLTALLVLGPPTTLRGGTTHLSGWAGVDALNVTLLHSGDGYGSVVPMDAGNAPCRPLSQAPYYSPTKGSVCYGGLARRSGVVAAVRGEVEASGGSVALVDAGNALLGSLYYATFGSEVIASYYNLMRYDAVKLEVHDFTSGLGQVANFTRLLTTGGNATATVVSSNLVHLNNDSRFVAQADGAQVVPYALVKLGGSGEVLGFVGTMAQGLGTMFANPRAINSTPELVAMRTAVGLLQNLGVNKIVASVSGASVADSIIDEVPGIDVLIVLSQLYGGPNTTNTTTSAGPYPTMRVMPWGQPVLIVGTGVNSGQYLGRLDLDFDDHGVIRSWRGAPIRLDDGSPLDAVMQADIVRRQAEVDQLAQRPLGSSLVDLAYEHRCMFGECTIGSWSVDVLRAEGRTQVAFVNGGTMYGGIPAGNITYGQLQTALPLQNGELQTYRLAGRYLWEALENSFKLVTDTELNLSQGVGRFLQVSGLRVLYNPREAVGWRVVDVTIETAPGVWTRLEPDQLYTITSFRWVSVLGGDEYTMIRDNLRDLRPIGITGAMAYLTALTRGPITSVSMGRLNTTSLTTRSCYGADSGFLCSGNGVCVLGRCQCVVGAAEELCAWRNSSDDALSAGAIVGIVIGSAVVAACVLVSAVFITAVLASRNRKRPADQEWLIDFNELEIGDLLGRGGYGEVYRGKWKGTGVAVKTISAERITREMKASFIKETSIMSRLRHPNCVLFMAASTKPPLLCIVMEYMALGSLYDLLHNELVNEIPFVLRLKLMYQAAKGMHFLHSSGIVHRDLKSLNLLLDHKWNVKVADFGLTVFRDSVKRKGDGDRSVVGSVPWMAPELLQRDTDHRNPQAPIEFVQLVDVYSFGIILWEVLTRKRPYEGLSPSQVAVAVIRSDLRPTLPAGVLGLADHERQYLNLMSACWHRDPSVRPAFHRIMDTLVKINNAAGGNSSSGSGFVFSSSSGSNSSGGGKADNGEAAGRARGPSDSMSLMSGPDLSSSRDSNGSYGNCDDGGSGGDGEGEERGLVHVPATKADRVPRRDVSFVVCDLARFDRVWQRNPAAADMAIRRFGGLVRHHAAGGGGHIHSRPSLHSGGTFMVAFAQPTAAVAFSLALQSDVRREAELWRHARVGITHRPGPCGAPADDRTRTTYHPSDYAECLRLVARCPPGRVVCSGAFHASFTEKTQSDATSDHHQQLRFTTRPDKSVRVALDTTGDDEDKNKENDDDEEECDEAVCSSDRCPWIIDAESIELGECIGEGSFAEVLEGTCDGRPVAVKRLFNSRLDDHGMRKLRKEAAILSGIDHPHVVKLMGLSVGHRSLLLVMELVPRGSLRTLLSNPSVGLKWPQRLAMLRDAALGLAFLHARGIVHRDIKSSNLLVDDDLRVKVADFGFATVKQDNCTMTRCGSPSWTAPEVLAPVFTTAAESGRNGDDDNGDDNDDDDDVVVDERVYSEKADVYSFGIVMWEVLTRHVPYAEGNLTTVAFDVIQGKRPPVPSDCPPAYADTMRRCWHEKPRKRPDMDDVLAFFAGDFASV